MVAWKDFKKKKTPKN